MRKKTHLHRFVLMAYVRALLVAQSVERWACGWKVAGSNQVLEGGMCEIISIYSTQCPVPVFWKRHKTEAPIQSTKNAGFLI